MILFLLLLVPAILFLWERIYRNLWDRELDTGLRFPRSIAYAGEEAELTEIVTNRKRFPLSAVEIGFRIPKGIRFLDAENIVVSDYVYKRDVFSLRGMEAVTRRYHLECQKRGRYPISQVTLRTWSLFHSRQYEIELEKTDELTVYAKRTDVSKIVSLCDTILGTAESTRSLYEDPFTFSSIREYTPQDPMKNINWKASARMGNLMVNTYASVRSEQFFIFLDISDRGIWKEEELVEKGISAAATLCQKLMKKGLETGLAINTIPPTVFSPKRGAEQLGEIERFLTEDFKEKEALPLEELATYPVTKDGRICIYISKNTNQEMTEKLRGLSNGMLPALMVVPVFEQGIPTLKVQMLS